MKLTVLIVDDEKAQRESLAGFLRKKGYETKSAGSGTEALEWVRTHTVDVICTDFKMPDLSGLELLKEVHSINPDIPVIIMTAYGSVENAVEAMKAGAFEYIQKPVDLDELLILVRRGIERSHLVRENRELRKQLEKKYSFEGIVSQSGEMEEVLNTAARVAASDATVLIRGESGTGKELIARAIYHASNRRDKPFVVVNCAALPETLLESELFGHEKGSFTGADRQRIGKFEQANGGTLFVDEVGDIPPQVQVKLLRALQFGTIERVGGDETIELNVRIVAATNRNLEELIREGEFREDLFYRLNVVPIFIPPLRKRKVDIPPLVHHFIRKYGEMTGKEVQGISREAMEMLLRYDFPGNIRELENVIQRAVVMTRGDLITTSDLPPEMGNESTEPSTLPPLGDLKQTVAEIEKSMIRRALDETNGNQVQAARLLGISERNLRYKMGKLGL